MDKIFDLLTRYGGQIIRTWEGTPSQQSTADAQGWHYISGNVDVIYIPPDGVNPL